MKKTPKLPKPLLHGEDIMPLFNLKPSKKVGFLLRKIREMQLAGELKTKKQAIAWLKKLGIRKDK
jgi:hypothetical protein